MNPEAPKANVSKLRRVLLLLLAFLLLLGIFHLVENIRGARAWAAAKAKVESKGYVWDWEHIKPKPVPDEQNVMGDPQMQAWFGKSASKGKPQPGFSVPKPTGAVTVAEIRLLAADAKPEVGAPVYDWAALKSRKQILDTDKLAPKPGRMLMAPQNFQIFEQAPPVGVASVIYVRGADTNFASEAKKVLGPQALIIPASNRADLYLLQRELVIAADYLALTDTLKPRFETIRAACQKPYSQLKGDYTMAYASPIYSFVTIRSLVQCLAARAQSHLLLGNPAAAAQELALLRQVNAILSKPGGPLYLVSVMIGVAVDGLHVSVISDGLRLGCWQEPQLAELQKYLAQVKLLPGLYESMNGERAALCQFALRKVRDDGVGALRSWEGKPPSWLGRQVSKALIPVGWIQQNAALASEYQNWIQDTVDPKKNAVDPARLTEAGNQIVRELAHKSPYKMLAALGVPNFSKAFQTACRNQNMVSMGALACALERHRLAAGSYPATLEALMPRYLEKVPAEAVAGQALKYRPTADGRYLLYSVGWNGKDDGGVSDKNNTADAKDWVWTGVPKKK